MPAVAGLPPPADSHRQACSEPFPSPRTEGGPSMKPRSPTLLVLMLLVLPVAARAQATGQITGIVSDGSGALLPGVTIEATNVATGAVRTAISGADGLYNLPLLQPGDYTVKASLAGFRSAQREGVRVTVTETARVPFELAVGEITETVSVIADA